MRASELFEVASYQPSDGESGLLYHISPHNFDQFKPLSHFGTKNAARGRAVTLSYSVDTQQGPKKFYIYTVRLTLGNVVEIKDAEHEHNYQDILHGLINANLINNDPKMYRKINNPEKLIKFCKEHDIDTIKYKNIWEDIGSYSYINLTTDQVRIVRKSYGPLNLSRGAANLGDNA